MRAWEVSEVEGQEGPACETKPITCGTQYHLQGDGVRIELNYRTAAGVRHLLLGVGPTRSQNCVQSHYTFSHRRELEGRDWNKKRLKKGFLKGGREGGGSSSVCIMTCSKEKKHEELLQMFSVGKESMGWGWGWPSEAGFWIPNFVYSTYKIYIYSSVPSNSYDTPRTVTE